MMAHPGRAAVRPVETYLATGRTTEQLGDRDAQGLGFDIHQGTLHSSNSLGRNATGTLACAACHVPEARLKGPGILADEERCEVSNRADHTVRRATVAALTPAGDALVRLHF